METSNTISVGLTSVAPVSTAQAVPQDSANREAQLFDNLVNHWMTHRERDLKVRLDMGKLLNDHLGDPTTRQGRGNLVITKAAAMLNIATSDLNRMRWYEYFNRNSNSCWGEVPNADRSWAKFKKLLPDLIRTLKGNEVPQCSSDRQRSISVDVGFLKPIESMTAKLRSNDFAVNRTKRAEMIKKMQELTSAFSEAVGIRFRLETETKVIEAGVREGDVTDSQASLEALATTAA